MTKSSLTNFHASSSYSWTPHATIETHSTWAIVTAHATPVHAVNQVAVAAAPAVASVGNAAAGYGYAAAAGHDYAPLSSPP